MSFVSKRKIDSVVLELEIILKCGKLLFKVHKKSEITSYYTHLRRSVLDCVPKTAKYVLSVGCASGITEAELVKQGMKVVGVEINSEAAKIARERGLTILEGNVSEIDVNINAQLYDCIIYADVLEHLIDPCKILKRHVDFLRPNGTVIISVPNFRHYSVLWQLFVRGQVHYVDAGILDRTHLRITTRKMLLQWFEKTGLMPVIFRYGIGGLRNKFISACFLGLLREFLASQLFIVGKKADSL